MDSLRVSLGLEESKTSSSYLAYLTSINLDQINAQNVTLSSELQSINQSLTALALRESQSFSASTADILEPLSSILSTVSSLEEAIPSIDKAATFNKARLHEISQSRKEAALLSRNENRLQELLDLPGMIKSCVAHGHYTEATDLSLHLQRVQARHPGSVLLKTLVEESTGHMQRMALQLLTLLNTPLKLAMALKVVGFLRRTGLFQEEELRFLFLKGRYDALLESWSALDDLKEAPDRYVKKYVEVFREQVFAIITQYSSIFPSREDGETDGEEDAFQHNLLPQFTQTVILKLQEVLEDNVPRIESQATKNTLLTQILYTSQSLARVGCEFIGLVISVFGDEQLWSQIVLNQRQMARRLD